MKEERKEGRKEGRKRREKEKEWKREGEADGYCAAIKIPPQAIARRRRSYFSCAP